jgi:hypothetical protein
MPHFIFTYQQPVGYVPGSNSDALAAWQRYFEQIADHVVDPGQPVFARTTIGEVGDRTQLGGYSVVAAADLDEAVVLATACPTVGYGGGVQVGELAELPPDHIAAQLRQRTATA